MHEFCYISSTIVNLALHIYLLKQNECVTIIYSNATIKFLFWLEETMTALLFRVEKLSMVEGKRERHVMSVSVWG